MKKMDKATFMRTLKIFGTLTVAITLVGYFFGNILSAFTEPAPVADTAVIDGQEQLASATLEQTAETTDEQQTEEVAEILDPTTFYVIQLGVFESLNNAAGLIGTLSNLGIPSDVIRRNDSFTLYSHIVGSRSQLGEVETALTQNNIDFFTRQATASETSPAWDYFLLAANELPFDMDSDFINSFASSDMPIFGMYNALGTSSFEPLSEERQNMLMAIYNWLNS